MFLIETQVSDTGPLDLLLNYIFIIPYHKPFQNICSRHERNVYQVSNKF